MMTHEEVKKFKQMTEIVVRIFVKICIGVTLPLGILYLLSLPQALTPELFWHFLLGGIGSLLGAGYLIYLLKYIKRLG